MAVAVFEGENLNRITNTFGIPVMGLLIVANANATVTMTLQDATTYAEAGFTATLTGSGEILHSDGQIGIYSFSVNTDSDPSLSSPFYTTCLSPNGLLDWAPHNCDFETFANANPGINPSSWASGNGDLWGIQNANYLFSTLSGQIVGGGIPDQNGNGSSLADEGAAMALAMYTALYNSIGYGVVGTGPFFVTGGGSGTVSTDYNADMELLAIGTINAADGGVLRPVSGQYGAGQDMILLGAGFPPVPAPVPEPTTILAWALLLLPFGASTFRILRKNRTV